MEKTSGLSGKYGSCGADGCGRLVVKLCTSLITTNQQACSSDTVAYHCAHSVTSLTSWLLICCKKDVQ